MRYSGAGTVHMVLVNIEGISERDGHRTLPKQMAILIYMRPIVVHIFEMVFAVM